MIIKILTRSIMIPILLVTSFWAANAAADALEDLVKNQLSSIEKEDIGRSMGRWSLDLEMERNPGQLSRDITRQPVKLGSASSKGFGKLLGIGWTSITSDMLKGKEPIEAYNMDAEALVNLIKSQNKSFDNSDNKNKIGVFWISEILYALTQSMLNAPLARSLAEESAAIVSIGRTTTKDEANITYEPADNLITVSRLNIKEGKKKYVLGASTYYNIETGKVWWKFSYSIGGKKVEWTEDWFPEIKTN